MVHGDDGLAQDQGGVHADGYEFGLVVVVWDVAGSQSVIAAADDDDEIVDSRDEETETKLAVEGEGDGRMTNVFGDSATVFKERAVCIFVDPSRESFRKDGREAGDDELWMTRRKRREKNTHTTTSEPFI